MEYTDYCALVEETDYYALVNYRGKIKYYHVEKHYNNVDIWINYIDYNPDRHSGVWVTKGKSRIVEKFEQGTDEYEYFNALKIEFRRLVDVLVVEEFNKSDDKTLPDMFYYASIGTDYYKKAYKTAYSSIKKPSHINF